MIRPLKWQFNDQQLAKFAASQKCKPVIYKLPENEGTVMENQNSAAQDFANHFSGLKCQTILADPPWQFTNRTGKMAPEHKRLSRYSTMTLTEIKELPVSLAADTCCHLYLWVPNALLPEGLDVMSTWGFEYKTNLVWHKIRKDGGPDGRGVGFYFRNTTELILFGIRGKMRTLSPGRRQVNILKSQKREHSRKPDELYDLIEECSPGPYLEMFARGRRSELWHVWGDQSGEYAPSWPTYANHSQSTKKTKATPSGKKTQLRLYG